MAQPKMKSMATGTTRARTRASMSRLRWMNSFTMMPTRREPTLPLPAPLGGQRRLRGEGPELLAEPRLALLVHEGHEKILYGGLHRVPICEEIRGAAQVGDLDLDDGAPEGLALDDGGRALGDELALVDEAEAVAQLRLVHVVGGDHDGRPLVGQASDQPPEVPP